jgi:hypothetical protein
MTRVSSSTVVAHPNTVTTRGCCSLDSMYSSLANFSSTFCSCSGDSVVRFTTCAMYTHIHMHTINERYVDMISVTQHCLQARYVQVMRLLHDIRHSLRILHTAKLPLTVPVHHCTTALLLNTCDNYLQLVSTYDTLTTDLCCTQLAIILSFVDLSKPATPNWIVLHYTNSSWWNLQCI